MISIKRNRRGLLAIALSLSLLTFLLAGAWFLSPLALVVQTAAGTRLVLPVRPGGKFSLRFIHSVHRTPVWEDFVVAGAGRMTLVSTEYESYGVGMPCLPSDGTFVQLDGRFSLRDLHRQFTEIPVRVGPEARHTLLYEGKEYPLHAWFAPGTLVYIRIASNYYLALLEQY